MTLLLHPRRNITFLSTSQSPEPSIRDNSWSRRLETGGHIGEPLLLPMVLFPLVMVIIQAILILILAVDIDMFIVGL